LVKWTNRKLKEEIEMTITETWWETIFTGAIAMGINKERIDELDEESFLYFKEVQDEMESNN
jgi:hypothetical protein